MNTPENFLEFKKEIDKEFDLAIQNKDNEMLEELNNAQREAERQGKDFYQLIYEMLVRYNQDG